MSDRTMEWRVALVMAGSYVASGRLEDAESVMGAMTPPITTPSWYLTPSPTPSPTYSQPQTWSVRGVEGGRSVSDNRGAVARELRRRYEDGVNRGGSVCLTHDLAKSLLALVEDGERELLRQRALEVWTKATAHLLNLRGKAEVDWKIVGRLDDALHRLRAVLILEGEGSSDG